MKSPTGLSTEFTTKSQAEYKKWWFQGQNQIHQQTSGTLTMKSSGIKPSKFGILWSKCSTINICVHVHRHPPRKNWYATNYTMEMISIFYQMNHRKCGLTSKKKGLNTQKSAGLTIRNGQTGVSWKSSPTWDTAIDIPSKLTQVPD